ncbi:L,D-transpeptidase [Dictyobacter arantiisoli]|nr:L,D-transpeptidase [Dictyobacter arantiisoli]
MSISLLFMMILSACGNPQVQNQANTDKANLDKAIANAQSIGVPDSLLRPIIAQENKINGTNAPLALFSSQPTTNYYSNLTENYQTLTVQVKGLDDQTTQQLGTQASAALKSFSTILSQRQSQGFVEAGNFTNTLTQTQAEMNSAHQPGQYAKVSQRAAEATKALTLLGTANYDLMNFQNVVKSMKSSNLDTTAMDSQATSDIQLFRKATTPDDFNKIISQIDAQTRTANTVTTQAIPYVGQYKLGQFQASINSLKQYGGDASSYQKQYTTDKSLLDSGKFIDFSTQLTRDMDNIHLPLLTQEATYDVTKLMNDSKNWGNAHPYYDSYDNQTYTTAYDYWNCTVYDLQTALTTAQTADDYQTIIDSAKQQRILFTAETHDAVDSTPYNQVHQSDLDLMRQLGATSGKVLITSTYNGTLRVYDNGRLVRSILVVSGMPDKPTPPGFTQITNRQSPAVFKSFEQDKNSPFYYPATPIHYAMMYHVGEYYYHDSWWRAADDYGPGKQFPHYAPEAFNSGTHGCINMSLDETAWLWNFTNSADTEPVYSIVY